jgi:hypothetical protein
MRRWRKKDTYLDPILQLCNNGVLGDEGQELALPAEGHGDDQGHEDDHLEDEQGKDKTVVERHGGQLGGVWLIGLGRCKKEEKGDGRRMAVSISTLTRRRPRKTGREANT